jgi:hypothetical protein
MDVGLQRKQDAIVACSDSRQLLFRTFSAFLASMQIDAVAASGSSPKASLGLALIKSEGVVGFGFNQARRRRG